MTPYIDENEIVSLTREIVRCPSVNPEPDTEKCATIISNRLNENGIDAKIIEGKKGVCNVVAGLIGRKKGKVLLLNGHMDVVAPGEGWTVDPFGGDIKDGKIYGRGTCDMKSGISSMMAALIGFKRSGKSFDGEIIFMAVGDEETGSRYGTRYLLEKKIGREADFAIVSEPTSLAVELGNRGLRWFDICVTGKACHAGRPHLGVNAIDYTARLVEAIQSFSFTHKDDNFELSKPSMSVTLIDGGNQVNVIPNRCRLSVDRRMLPGETTESVMAELKKMIQSISVPDINVDVEMRPGFWDPYLISDKEPIVQVLTDAYRRCTGSEPTVRTKLACTDGSHIYHMGKIPAVLFGPGIPEMSHKIDECVPIQNLVIATDIFMTTIDTLMVK